MNAIQPVVTESAAWSRTVPISLARSPMQPYERVELEIDVNDDRTFTVSEVAFVLAEPVKAVKKALDTGPVVPTLKRRSGAVVRTVAWKDMFYLFLIRALRDQLAATARAELYAAMANFDPARDEEIRLGRLRVDVADLKREFADRAHELAALGGQVDFRSDGEPLVKGLDIEIYRISALVDGGMTDAEILEDFPSLAQPNVDTARAYAAAYPKVGRPYPDITFKRALAGAGLEALDEVLAR